VNGLKRSQYSFLCWFVILLVVAVGAIVTASGMGFISIAPGAVVKCVLSAVSGRIELLAGLDEVYPFVVLDVRLPRILCAALVGAGLAVSGVVFQGILLNPLADPYTLGISSGAAFGASLALLLDITTMSHVSVPLFAFIGAVSTLFVVLWLSTFNGQMSANTLILSGVIVGAILSAGISLMKYLADEQVSVIIFWLMGSFASRTWMDVLVILVALVFGLVVTVFYGRDLNILALGGRDAAALGVDTVAVRRILLVSASLLAAVCVSVSGIIGFIGLIVPHLMRFLVGPDNRQLVILSALAGAILLLLADTVSRAVLPVEVPVGVLTALLGGPFFCYIFRSRSRGGWHG
jgi:iron complex transport system permease protein